MNIDTEHGGFGEGHSFKIGGYLGMHSLTFNGGSCKLIWHARD